MASGSLLTNEGASRDAFCLAASRPTGPGPHEQLHERYRRRSPRLVEVVHAVGGPGGVEVIQRGLAGLLNVGLGVVIEVVLGDGAEPAGCLQGPGVPREPGHREGEALARKYPSRGVSDCHAGLAAGLAVLVPFLLAEDAVAVAVPAWAGWSEVVPSSTTLGVSHIRDDTIEGKGGVFWPAFRPRSAVTGNPKAAGRPRPRQGA
jgi:hypothetical protein